jgi:hypothetical protein
MNDENVGRITIIRLCGGYETPVIRIGESGKKRLR